MEQQNIKNMRDYSITKKKAPYQGVKGEWYNAQVTDSFGVDHQNWFESSREANDWVVWIWETEKEPLTKDQEMDMLATAIWGCTKLDKELGLLKGNQDNLD